MKPLLVDLDDTIIIEKAAAEESFIISCSIAEKRYGVDKVILRQNMGNVARRFWHSSPHYPYARRIGISSWEGLWGDFSGDGEELTGLRKWIDEYRIISWSTALKEHGIDNDDLAFEMSSIFISERRKRHRFMPHAEEVLLKLMGKHNMVLITNGAPALQREKINALGIQKFFKFIVISGDIGIGKPEPAIFEKALELLNTEPSNTVIIGNSLHHDIAGAVNAGIKSIWLNNDGSEPVDGIIPDAIIKDLEELPGILKRFP